MFLSERKSILILGLICLIFTGVLFSILLNNLAAPTFGNKFCELHKIQVNETIQTKWMPDKNQTRTIENLEPTADYVCSVISASGHVTAIYWNRGEFAHYGQSFLLRNGELVHTGYATLKYEKIK